MIFLGLRTLPTYIKEQCKFLQQTHSSFFRLAAFFIFQIGYLLVLNRNPNLISQGFNSVMSDTDRSSSEDNISVSSQEDSKVDFSEDEEDLITRLYNLLGQRWALIAGRIPGRNAEEIEKYCSRRYASE